jgi:hypothetical protein
LPPAPPGEPRVPPSPPSRAASAEAPQSQTRFAATFENVYSDFSLQVPWYITSGFQDWEGNITGAAALAAAAAAALSRQGEGLGKPRASVARACASCVKPAQPSHAWGAAQPRIAFCVATRPGRCAVAAALAAARR